LADVLADNSLRGDRDASGLRYADVVTGTITELHAARATGVIQGEDGKLYGFRGRDLRDCWFHDLAVGGIVTFEPLTGQRALDATDVRTRRVADV
jgi:hypothetical protein